MSSTRAVPLSSDQRRWIDAAHARLSASRLTELLVALTGIHSPTGAAGTASQYLVGVLSGRGFDARYLPMNSRSGNVLAERRGSGGGASLLLYAPVDTHLEGNADDYPWAGPEGLPDLVPEAKQVGDWVYGLGSSNPKAMIATLIEAATAVLDAGVPLTGDLMLGFADGGMPVDIAARDHAGLSNGVQHLLYRGAAADFALIMKPWNFVYSEEPGMGWFKVRLYGTYGYAGVPRGTPGFRSSIVPLVELIPALETWLIDYAERNTSGTVKPHGWIAGVRAGSPERPSFPSAVTEVFLDVRINPRTSPGEVKSQFAAFMDAFKQSHPDLLLDWEMYGSAPGGTTDPDNWIIQSARRGWESVEGVPHPVAPYMGGQTDGAALRRLGVPTARLGWPWPAEGSPLKIAEGLGGMGATYIPDLMPCAQKIVYAIIDTLTRPRDEVGL
jgi:acetylornithine deacetylase/succinyl-diaminopimelate desuccinylase-like protein